MVRPIALSEWEATIYEGVSSGGILYFLSDISP